MTESLEQRVESFNQELKPLLEKYKLVLVGVPFIRPNGGIAAQVQVAEVPPENEKGGKEELATA